MKQKKKIAAKEEKIKDNRVDMDPSDAISKKENDTDDSDRGTSRAQNAKNEKTIERDEEMEKVFDEAYGKKESGNDLDKTKTKSDPEGDSNRPDSKIKKNCQKLKTFFKEKKYRPLRIAIYCLLAVIIIFLVVTLLTNKINEKFEIVSVYTETINNNIIDNDSKFIIKTKGGSLEDVKERIYLEPALDYEISKINSDEYELKLANPISDNTVFNVDWIENEIPRYKWAFQTKKDLSVSKIYPADGATYVAENSAVQITFSYSDVENFENHFRIDPAIEGYCEKKGNVWTFQPTESFKPQTTYTVTIAKGLKSGEQILENDYTFSFSTFERSTKSNIPVDPNSKKSKISYISADKTNTFLPEERPIIRLTNDDADIIGSIELVRINDSSEYIKYLENNNASMESMGNIEFTKSNEKTIIFNNPLPEGYYVAYLKDQAGNKYENANIQINHRAAYAVEVERDALVWVAENGELKADAKIYYKDKEYRTNNDGIATLENISDYSDKTSYLTVENGDKPLVVGLFNFKNDNYPNSYIYTDRPLYKSTDKIRVWGFVPLDFFQDYPDRNGFSIEFEEIKQNVEVREDGTFIATVDLKNHTDCANSIELIYKDRRIASKYINIEDYNAKTYIYEIKADKNFVTAGNNYDFDVSVKHITGLNAPNKDVIITYGSKDYHGVTDEKGLAHFSLPTLAAPYQMYNYKTTEYESITIESSGSSRDKWVEHASFYIINSKLDVGFKDSYKDKKLTINASNLNLEDQSSLSNAPKDPYNGKITAAIYEIQSIKTQTGYEYNNYTKKNEPKYVVDRRQNFISYVNGEIVDGKFVYDYSDFNFKEDDEQNTYLYELRYDIMDSEDRKISGTYDYAYERKTNGNQTKRESIYTGGGSYYNNEYIDGDSYDLYEYGLDVKQNTENTNDVYRRGNKYSIGDMVNLSLIGLDGAAENKGKILEVIYKEKIIQTELKSSNELDVEYTKNLYPGSNITAAYFLNGRFYRMPSYYLDYDEEDSELSVDIQTEKKDYEPSNEVSGKIIVKDANGNNIDGAVNISVVNEGVFNMINDSTYILSNIYSDKMFDLYTYSTYRNYNLNAQFGGGRGAGGGGRSNFGDTIYFEQIEVKNGTADFRFKLNDEITSFRITAHAIANNDTIKAGVNFATINSYLPLSIISNQPKNVKYTDDTVLNASAVTGAGSIQYKFEIQETGAQIEASGTLNQEVYANFGKLKLGKYHATISAEDSDGNKDALTYEFDIVESSQEVAMKQTINLQENKEIKPTKNPINIEIYNKNTARYVRLLDQLASVYEERLDTIVAYHKATEFKNKYYGTNDIVNVPSLNGYIQDGVAKPLSDAGADLVLTGLLNYYATDYIEFDKKNFGIDFETDIDKAMKQYFVLASFKEPVLDNLRSLMEKYYSLSEENQLLLGLSLAFLGDFDNAKIIAESGYNYDGTNGDLRLILRSFVSDDGNEIIEKISSDPSSDYLNFAILSFFENNDVEISKTETVKIQYSGKEETVNINGLGVQKLTIYSDDLNSLHFISSSDDLVATYYYQGGSESIEDANNDLAISVSGEYKKSEQAQLEIDVSQLQNKNGIFYVALPNSIKFNKSNMATPDGLNIIANNDHVLKLGLNSNYSSNKITIPVFLAMPGEAQIESVIFVDKEGGYHLSNNMSMDVK